MRSGMGILAGVGLTWTCLAAGAAPQAGAVGAAPKPDARAVEFFEARVRPLLAAKCAGCHTGASAKGGLDLGSREAILKGGENGPAVVPGEPEKSLLIRAVRYEGPIRMPLGTKLKDPEIRILTEWVRMGAPWGVSAAVKKIAPEKFWAFQPVKRPAVPAVKARWWPKTEIDRFVLAKLETKGLKPNPYADRRTLIRRATFDLTGLPPTPEEVESFVNDRSPDAWRKVIDRLLASPAYGEKWGRHWLDLVRFAESNSYERDGTKPNAWRYRDYVIESFNQDKPYDRFILEQLAGDELAPRTPERLIATGYYRLGIWDDEPADPKQALYDDLDDIVSTTGQVFLGMTVGCARCHDHKLDPFPQKDYYRLLSFFAGVQRYGVRSHESVEKASLRPISPEAEQQRHAAEVAVYQAELQANRQAIDSLERRVLPDLAPVEKEEWRTETARPAIVKKRVPALLSEEEFARYTALLEERNRLRRSPPRALEMALCVTEVGPKPREMHVLLRGNPHVEGEKVEPGFPSVLPAAEPRITPPATGETCGRRLALARWIASPENPLTARVMVNRVWQYHFGRGIVRSPNNFGFQGDRPTHPELLDWLASEFVASGWRLKPLHRRIMLSAAYQMSSRANAAALAKDPENDLFWRFDMRRLQAEEIRDAILAVNGSLNLKRGGPSFYPTMPAEVLAGQSRPGENWGRSSPEEQCRRSVYIFVKRSLITPILASFDGPDTDFTCPVRFSTTQPTQALGMLNSAFINEQARVFAAFLRQQAGADPAAQVRLALTRVLQRPATAAEVARGVRLIESLQREEQVGPEQALATFCVVALNLNEFIYLD